MAGLPSAADYCPLTVDGRPESGREGSGGPAGGDGAVDGRRPMEIRDLRFEKGRLRRDILCDGCGFQFRGNAVGAFYDTERMPSPEFRRPAWERGEWDASWYCIGCFADFWHCSQERVMERLGFTTRQAQKNKFMAACAATPRRPAFIYDTRFDNKRTGQRGKPAATSAGSSGVGMQLVPSTTGSACLLPENAKQLGSVGTGMQPGTASVAT